MKYWNDYRTPKQIDNYKSELEFITSRWLAKLKIAFIYEPGTYKTNKGNYTPDFYLPEINTYIEVRPDFSFFSDSYIELLKEFAYLKSADILLVTRDKLKVIEFIKWGNPDTNEFDPEAYLQDEFDVAQIIVCSHCGKKSFCTSYGIYSCRHCKVHEGDHDCQDLNNSFKETFQQFYWEVKK